MLEKLLITGAAGGIAQMIQGQLDGVAKTLRFSDLVEPKSLPLGAEFVRCNLDNIDAVMNLVDGCDGILHLGGVSTEQAFDPILSGNIVGIYNLYEAARKNNQPRIFLASSNHVIGFYKTDDRLDVQSSHRPDGWYGISKSFAEATALMYYHKFGQETAMVRIGSCYPEPKEHRMLSTWLAPEDFLSLVNTVFTVPELKCPVIYGVSNNDQRWWDNSAIDYLGWQPKRNASEFKEKLQETVTAPDPENLSVIYQGGAFVTSPIIEHSAIKNEE